MIDQIIKFEKDKINHSMTEMRARNKNKEGILGIQQLCDCEWTVPWSSQTEVSYTVNKVLSAPRTCELTCNFCFLCVYMH